MNKVYLVGAGPGDPELITLKAKRLIEQADSILYDHLASAELLSLAPASAERVYVGKKKSDHAMSQEEICALLVDRGRKGRNVVRLKGGDPFIFGRGGEEAEALSDAGVSFEVVPGVTSPLGIAAYTGVPLTHRDHTSVVTFITGHDVDKIDWAKVGTAETLVIFMGLSHFDEIARNIIEGGRAPETPAMVVRWGTRPTQETIVGTLKTLPGLIHEQRLRPPATIVVGEVIHLREKLDWFGKLPLFGQTVVVTRAREQAAALSAPLRQLGAEVLEIPAIEIQAAADYGPLDRAIAELGSYDWLIFTSANGVKFFLDRLQRSAFDLRAIRGRICAIGPATKEALSKVQLKADLVGEEFVAEGLLDALRGYEMTGKRVLLARAAVARDILPVELTNRGATVHVVEAYRTIAAPHLAFDFARVTELKDPWVTFTSSSTVDHLVSAVGADCLGRMKLASIGPVTSATMRKYGLAPTIEAPIFTTQGILEAILSTAIIQG